MSTRRNPFSGNKQQRPKPAISSSNPFDSISDSELDLSSKPAKASSASAGRKEAFETNQFSYNEDAGRGFSAARNRYKNDFRDSGGIENQSVQELENYAVYKAEETTSKLNGCLRIAEEIREDGTKTLVTLHQQGEQITRTHQTAADIEHDLSRVYSFLLNFPLFVSMLNL